MKQVLFTRFAMRFEEGNPRRRFENREWVDYRLALLLRYCLPSVRVQKTEFDWWFLVHPKFPGFDSLHAEELSRYGKILWIEDAWREDQTGVGDLLKDEYKDQWVCSTRLDSDDILRNDHLLLVKEQATEEEAWISFPRGYMMKNGLVARRVYDVNPFISHVEYADPFRSVFRINHMDVNKQKNWKTIDVPGWVQVDHGENLKNRVKRKLPDFHQNKFDAAFIKENFTW